MLSKYIYLQERQWLDYLETFCAEDVQVLSIYWHFLLTMLVWVPLAAMVITVSGFLFKFFEET